jgi:hypothetical protein
MLSPQRWGLLSAVEKAEVEKQVKELLTKGFIEPSVSPYGPRFGRGDPWILPQGSGKSG